MPLPPQGGPVVCGAPLERSSTRWARPGGAGSSVPEVAVGRPPPRARRPASQAQPDARVGASSSCAQGSTARKSDLSPG
eukprot:3249453-Pyramimonas_sp.AAC.2